MFVSLLYNCLLAKMSEEAAPPMDENEKRIVNEFCHLLEKSKQLFNGLR